MCCHRVMDMVNTASSMNSHTLPQLPLTLCTLQLQPVHRILQPLLLLHQPFQLRRLRRTVRARHCPRPRPRRTTTPIHLPALIRAKPALLQLAFRLQGFLAAGELLDVVGC